MSSLKSTVCKLSLGGGELVKDVEDHWLFADPLYWMTVKSRYPSHSSFALAHLLQVGRVSSSHMRQYCADRPGREYGSDPRLEMYDAPRDIDGLISASWDGGTYRIGCAACDNSRKLESGLRHQPCVTGHSMTRKGADGEGPSLDASSKDVILQDVLSTQKLLPGIGGQASNPTVPSSSHRH